MSLAAPSPVQVEARPPILDCNLDCCYPTPDDWRFKNDKLVKNRAIGISNNEVD